MGERAQRKRFARAVDDEAARTDDQQLAAELAIVGQLRQASTNTVTDQQTRDDIAVRMGAKAVMQGAEPATAEPARPTRSAFPARLRRSRLRPVLAATLTLATALATLAVVFSADAIPGDALYAVKRVRESTALALTLDDRAAALKQLDHAAERVTELTKLATHSGHRDDIADAYRTGLSDFDQAARAATVTLTTIGTNSDGGVMDELRTWAHRQEHRLDKLRPVPVPAAAHFRTGSATLLHRIQQRTTRLHDRLACYRITTGATDSLGPLPATGSCVMRPDGRPDRKTTNDNDTHDHRADSASPTRDEASDTPRSTGQRTASPHQRAAAPTELTRSSETSASLAREPYHPDPATPEPPPNGPPHQRTDHNDVPPRSTPPDLLRTLDGILTRILPADPNT